MNKITKLDPRISIIGLCVRDMKTSYDFYANGLGFPTPHEATSPWVAFKLNGLLFSLYEYKNLKDEAVMGREVNEDLALDRHLFHGMGLAYNTREKHQVSEVLELAQKAGGTIEKMPKDTDWGGFSGYFSDPDGHLWEVAWADFWKFDDDGNLQI